jgi:hypothetical protein
MILCLLIKNGRRETQNASVGTGVYFGCYRPLLHKRFQKDLIARFSFVAVCVFDTCRKELWYVCIMKSVEQYYKLDLYTYRIVSVIILFKVVKLSSEPSLMMVQALK